MTFREFPDRAILSIRINLSVSQCIETPFKKWQRKAFPLGIYQYLRFEEDTGWYICAGNGAKLAKFSYIWEALFNVSLMWSCQGHTGNILIACFTFFQCEICLSSGWPAGAVGCDRVHVGGECGKLHEATQQEDDRPCNSFRIQDCLNTQLCRFLKTWSQDGPGHLRLCALCMTPAQNLHSDGWFWLEVGMQQTWKCYLT